VTIPRFFCIISTYLLFTAALAAPETASGDRAAITQCMSASHDKKACVGMVADECIKNASSRDSYVDDAKACAVREQNVWDERLRASLKIVNDSYPALHSAIADAQSNWLKSRDGLCLGFDNIDPGMYLGGSDYCRLKETGRRALIIECMSLTHDQGGSAEICIGSLAGHCKSAKDEDAKACASRELAYSMKRLQTAIRHSEDIRDVQSYWMKSREQVCPLFAVIDPGADRLGSDRCRQFETIGRAVVLEHLAATAEEH
jgi:lysozyme inhibitor LprI